MTSAGNNPPATCSTRLSTRDTRERGVGGVEARYGTSPFLPFAILTGNKRHSRSPSPQIERERENTSYRVKFSMENSFFRRLIGMNAHGLNIGCRDSSSRASPRKKRSRLVQKEFAVVLSSDHEYSIVENLIVRKSGWGERTKNRPRYRVTTRVSC